MNYKTTKASRHWQLALPGLMALLFTIMLSACGDDKPATLPNAVSPATTRAAVTTAAPQATTNAATANPTTLSTTIAPTTVAPTTTAPNTTVARTTAAPATTTAPDGTTAATTSNATTGKELQGQLLALTLKPGDIDLKVVEIENLGDLKSGSISASPVGVFVGLQVDVANVGKDPAGLYSGSIKLLDAKGHLFESASSDAYTLLELQDNKKYVRPTTVQPGTTRRFIYLFDLPQNITGLKLAPGADFMKTDRAPSEASFKPASAGNGQDSGAGPELKGQLTAADDNSTNLDVQVTDVERKTEVTGDHTEKAKGVFIIVQVQVANIGKYSSFSGYQYLILQDSTGRKFTAGSNTAAGDILHRLDRAKYTEIGSVLPGFTQSGMLVYDIPVDAAGLKLAARDGSTTNRQPDAASFKKSGGVGPDSGAGPELVSRTFTKDQVDYTVTKVYRLKELKSKGRSIGQTDGIFLVVVYEAANKSGKTVYASPATLIDGQSRRYPSYVFTSLLDDVPEATETGGNLADSQKAVRFALYEVPKDATHFTLEPR